MPPNPLLFLASVDCDAYAKMLTDKPLNIDGISEHLCTGIEAVVKAGAAFLAIASNTGHIAVPLVRTRFPDLPVLHIGDCTAAAIKASGANNVGLLGTEPTMQEEYLKEQLRKHGICTLVPESEKDLTQIFQYIMDELGFNVFKETTREFFVAQIRALAARGAQGVILGCTEIDATRAAVADCEPSCIPGHSEQGAYSFRVQSRLPSPNRASPLRRFSERQTPHDIASKRTTTPCHENPKPPGTLT